MKQKSVMHNSERTSQTLNVSRWQRINREIQMATDTFDPGSTVLTTSLEGENSTRKKTIFFNAVELK